MSRGEGHRPCVKMAEGVDVLHGRVATLDSGLSGSDANNDQQAIIRCAEQFITVLDEVVSIGDHQATPIASSSDADAVVSASRLISRLGAAESALGDGSVMGRPQYWIATGTLPWLPPRAPVLSPERLIAPPSEERPRRAKPLGHGLYTSTGFSGTQGMWRIYLDLGHYSANFPYPWNVWRNEIDLDANIFDVTTAARWEELLLSYPTAYEGLVYPDWHAIGSDWDAVHVTARAIAAIQGMRIQTSEGTLAPSYWDVETTVWLRWRFTTTELVETVSPLRIELPRC